MITKGIWFGEIHSFYDLNLVLSSRNIFPAKPKTNYVDLPGGDGSLDLTEAHGEIRYHDRDLQFLFTVNPDEIMPFEAKFTQVSNALNGKYFENITDDKEPDYYYSGRAFVDEYKQDKYIGTITISVKAKPYKMRHSETIVSFDLSEELKTVILRNGRKSVIPTITCTAEATLIFGANTLKLSAGTHNILEVYMTEGDNTAQVSGSGTITFAYREGEL